MEDNNERKAHAPALSNSVNGEEPSSGLHDAACCASSSCGESLGEVDKGFNSLIKYRLKSKNLVTGVSDQNVIDESIKNAVMDNLFAYGVIPKSSLDGYYSKAEVLN